MKIEQTNDILKALKGDSFLETKLCKKDIVEDKELAMHIARKGLLSRAFECLSHNGEELTLKDLTSSANWNEPSLLSLAAEYNQLKAIDEASSKTGEKFAKDTLLGASLKGGMQVFLRADYYDYAITALAAKSGCLGELLAMIQTNGEKLEKKDVIDGEEPNKYLRYMLSHKGWEPLAEEMNKQGFPITRNIIMNFGSGLTTNSPVVGDRIKCPLDTIIECQTLQSLQNELLKKVETLSRNDFLETRGTNNQVMVSLLLNNQLDAAQDILRKNGEKPLAIDDLSLKDRRLFTSSNIEKIFGIKGFSDNPKQIKALWEKLPKEHKTEKAVNAYNKVLRASLSKTVADTIKGKTR